MPFVLPSSLQNLERVADGDDEGEGVAPAACPRPGLACHGPWLDYQVYGVPIEPLESGAESLTWRRRRRSGPMAQTLSSRSHE